MEKGGDDRQTVGQGQAAGTDFSVGDHCEDRGRWFLKVPFSKSSSELNHEVC